ncbi:EcsC family protein [Knoellia locipacati]|uniref:EcsC family protein n=1 Tax=Knoellia locipacati TaxID=882824 RepID=UPI00384AE4BE
MSEPSEYELDAWAELQRFRGRPSTRIVTELGQRAASGLNALGERTSTALEKHPRAQEAVSRGQQAASKGGRALGQGAKAFGEVLPDWTGTTLHAARRSGAKVARAGLSPKRVVSKHRKHGHSVRRLSDVRSLDLEQVDAVRGRAASWYYPASAALSGVGSAIVITGGQVATAASAGAAAAPSAGAVMGAMAGDAAWMLGIGSRSVGHIALHYGFDPEEPSEKLFILSIVNAGTALTSGAKTAAMRDLSQLTQSLVRGKTWAVLNESVVARVANAFAKKFTTRLTKQGLGKLVPAVGVVIAGSLNWATAESIVDAANFAYRRRFLLEKYPQLLEAEPTDLIDLDGAEADESDEVISVVDELKEAGGPDLR